MRTLRDIDVKNRTVLVRVDYNVPLSLDNSGNPVVTSDLRIRASLPTLQYLLDHDARKIILLSHLGRPDGVDEGLSLKPIAKTLSELLGQKVAFIDKILGADVQAAVQNLPKQGILLLENLRFDPRETANNLSFAKEIVSDTGAEIFVQDAFATTHRAHASTSAISELLPTVAGLLVEHEVDSLSNIFQKPKRPFTLVLGGAKVSDKEPLIKKFLPLADHILIGGKIAVELSETPVDWLSDPKIYLAEDFDEDGSGQKLDIGPISTAHFVKILQESQTALWNGLLGKAEDPAFSTSSEIVAKFLGENPGIDSLICGGDTTGFVLNLLDNDPNLHYDLISTGGGATLEYLLGGKMPGLEKIV